MSQTKTSSAADAISTLPVIDEVVLTSLSNDLSDTMMPSVVETFLAELDALVANLTASVRHADFAAAAEHAHSLKGSAAIFGAARLEATAHSIERTSPRLTAQAAEDCLVELQRHTSAVAKALRRRYPAASPTVTAN